MTNQKEQCVIYARTNGGESDMLSQLNSLKEKADLEGMEVVAEFTDTASSSINNPGTSAMLKYLNANPGLTIILLSWDKLTRKVEESKKIIEMLEEGIIDRMIYPNGEYDIENKVILDLLHCFEGSDNYSYKQQEALSTGLENYHERK